jgi:hypothetical protein
MIDSIDVEKFTCKNKSQMPCVDFSLICFFTTNRQIHGGLKLDEDILFAHATRGLFLASHAEAISRRCHFDEFVLFPHRATFYRVLE